MPDCQIRFDDEKDMLFVRNKGTVGVRKAANVIEVAALDPDVYDLARQSAPGWDIRYIKQQWRSWIKKQDAAPKSSKIAILGFCRKWFEKRGSPR